MAGEFLYFSLYVLQQLGVMLGVGAQTILLCTHLVAVHRAESESGTASYAHAARVALGTGIFLIIASGVGAVTLHVLSGQLDIVLAPAFLFKWILIGALLVAFLFVRTSLNNILYALTGGTWYALFLVHSLGPITTWEMLLELYVAWMVVFGVAWALFVGLMHWRKVASGVHKAPAVIKEAKKVAPPPSPVVKVSPPQPPPVRMSPPPPPVPKAAPVAPPKPIPVVPPAPPVAAPAPPMVVVATPVVEKAPAAPVQKPVVAPVVTIVPTVKKLSWWQKLLQMLAPKPSAPSPVAAPVVPKPIAVSVPKAPPVPTPPVLPPSAPTVPPTPLTIAKLAPAPAAPLPVLQPLSLTTAHTTPAVVPTLPPAPAPQKSFIEEVIDHLHVPALRIMPQRVEDIGKQNRPPVVKLGELS